MKEALITAALFAFFGTAKALIWLIDKWAKSIKK